MVELLYSSSHGQLQFADDYPPGYKGPSLAGGKAFYFSSEFGSVTMQEITGNQFTSQLYLFQFLKKTTLFCKLRQGLHSLLFIKPMAVVRLPRSEPF